MSAPYIAGMLLAGAERVEAMTIAEGEEWANALVQRHLGAFAERGWATQQEMLEAIAAMVQEVTVECAGIIGTLAGELAAERGLDPAVVLREAIEAETMI